MSVGKSGTRAQLSWPAFDNCLIHRFAYPAAQNVLMRFANHGRDAMIRILLLPLIAICMSVVSPSTRAMPVDLFFSEYVEGSSNNKALEIFNGTGTAINLGAGAYNVQMFFNGSVSAGLTINLTGTVADGDVFVLADSDADPAVLMKADQTSGDTWFNGDDAVVLRKGASVIDVIGQIGSDPGTQWGSLLQSTADNTLRRKSTVLLGDANGADAFSPAVEWEGFASNTFDGLGGHVVVRQTTPVVRVPEPGTLALLLLTLGLIAARWCYFSSPGAALFLPPSTARTKPK